jgi:uncharacterized protein YjbI with pentapeptide repeats
MTPRSRLTWEETRERLIAYGVDPSRLPEVWEPCINLSVITLRNRDVRGAYLRLVLLINADLSYCKLQGATLYGAALAGATLVRANLTNADLRYADLTMADLRRARCIGADFAQAHLHHARVDGADFTGAKLKCAKFTEDNTCEEGEEKVKGNGFQSAS